jgi:predicted phage baseplate assembly protein
MPLPPPNLDDRTFQDIVDEAKRLIPQYTPEWTNHNVSDPGVALIELFAWMSEMVMFRLNQVPERLYVHFLNLVGIEPFPPSVARADLTFWLSTVLDSPVAIPAGTQVATSGGVAAEPVIFSTTRDLVVAAPSLRGALTVAGEGEVVTDVWDDLSTQTAPVTCFRTFPLRPGDAFLLGFDESAAGLVLRLSLDARAEGVGIRPRTPPIAWEAWSGEAWIPADVHDDTTGGLNQNGAVTLLVPMEHEVLTLGGVRAYWVRARLAETVDGVPTYKTSPQVRAVRVDAVGGTVPAEHSATVGREPVGRSLGAPGQEFRVSRTPVLPRTEGERVRVVELNGATDWTEVDDFTASGHRDRHVVWDGATGTVRFGPLIRYADGTRKQHGAVPADGAEITVTGYRHGGGAVGNVGAGTLTVLRTTLPYVDSVSNLRPAYGGVDAESVAEAMKRGPMTLRTGQRAVTPGDFERLTRESSVEVARARCLPATEPGGPVRVLVVPHVPGAPEDRRLDDFALSPHLFDVVSRHLDERRLVGTAVEVGTPYYQGLSVAALLRALPGRSAALLRQRAVDLLARYVDPLVGGPDGDGWRFDADINAAAVTALLESMDGIDRVEEVLLFEYDLRSGRRIGAARDVVRLSRHALFLSAAHQVVVR